MARRLASHGPISAEPANVDDQPQYANPYHDPDYAKCIIAKWASEAAINEEQKLARREARKVLQAAEKQRRRAAVEAAMQRKAAQKAAWMLKRERKAARRVAGNLIRDASAAGGIEQDGRDDDA